MDDGDDYLHYLKYSLKEDDSIVEMKPLREYQTAETQFPEIENKHTHTDKKSMLDKETETGDELNQIIGNYILKMDSKNHTSLEPSRSDKMVQAFTEVIEDPSSSSSDSEGNRGIFKRHRGKSKTVFRLAQATNYMAMLGGQALVGAVDYLAPAPENNDNQEEVISVHSSPPISVHSSQPHSVVNVSSSSSSYNPPMIAPPTDLPIPTSLSSSSRRSSEASASASASSAYPRKKKL